MIADIKIQNLLYIAAFQKVMPRPLIMDWKNFLKPERKKLILPIIFVLISVYVFSASSSAVAVFDKYTCRMADESKQYILAEKENNTQKMAFLNESAQNIVKEINSEINKRSAVGLRETAFFISTIDPVFPFPCELSQSPICAIYLNRQSYNCMADLANFTKSSIGNKTIADSIQIREFSEPTISFVLNAVFLFFEGYLLSCLIILFLRKKK